MKVLLKVAVNNSVLSRMSGQATLLQGIILSRDNDCKQRRLLSWMSGQATLLQVIILSRDNDCKQWRPLQIAAVKILNLFI